jgi:hypothetical protein
MFNKSFSEDEAFVTGWWNDAAHNLGLQARCGLFRGGAARDSS